LERVCLVSVCAADAGKTHCLASDAHRVSYHLKSEASSGISKLMNSGMLNILRIPPGGHFNPQPVLVFILIFQKDQRKNGK
jgi:hypothetical protein